MKKLIFIALAVCVSRLASAAEVTEETATRAAEGFVAADAVGKVVLAGCTVDSVVARGRLWIAHLAPSGHVILSGSDLVDPIVGFSKNDFAEPDPESPAFAVLEGADASVAAREAQGGGTRHERWTKLLGGGTSKKGLLKAADVKNPDTVVIPPFLESQYDQWQPYNDYAPVFEPDENHFASGYGPYRGRCPCGCVATAAAQGFRHFRWPARIDRVDSFNHNFKDANKIAISFPIRFVGHEPICWNTLSNNYAYSYRKGYQTCYDLRSGVDEAVRYPIARLILWCDVLANMYFTSGGSSSNYDTVAENMSDWYVKGSWVDMLEGATQIRNDISAGVPCQVSIGAYNENNEREGHEVVAHGWAESGSIQYLYLNFGWGGTNDGYYNIAGDIQNYTEKKVYVGHYPRAKPQIDPLPKVCETNLTLNWHFPDFYTNNLSGFSVSISRTATTPSTFLDDFSASTGSSSSNEIYVDSGNDLLYSDYAASGNYTYAQSFILTSASELSFKVSSYAAISSTMKIQVRFNGGDWQTVSTPDLDEGFGSNNWNSYRIYLGGHGGEAAQFRIVREWGGTYYVDEDWNRVDYGCVRLDDFTVTNVLAPVAPEIQNVGKTARSLTLTGLDAGATYSFAVTPNISGALVSGESSEPAVTSIAGTRHTPIPGEQTYTPATLAFSASDTSGTWSYLGTAVDDTSVGDGWDCSITCAVLGEITPTSTLSFEWTADEYYFENSYDVLSATFTTLDGTESSIWCITNTSAKTSRQQVSCSLAALNGQTGKIVISYSHKNLGYGDGGVIYAPTVTNVLVPSVPAVAWNTETLTALGTPEILSVSAVEEGFYAECGTNATAFTVKCSPNVVTLRACPSHLALVGDDDVSVTPKGNGRFAVTVTPSGITEDNARSRLILTLAATDANGTTVYKDLSLRFEAVDMTASEVQVDITPADGGDSYSVSISYDWLETNGLVTPGSDASAYEAEAVADSDGDGLPNWAEYVCGTSPTDADDKLSVTIRMENGQPVVETYLDGDIVQDRGFRIVTKGTNNLSDWEDVTDTKTSPYHFFKVVIEQGNP